MVLLVAFHNLQLLLVAIPALMVFVQTANLLVHTHVQVVENYTDTALLTAKAINNVFTTGHNAIFLVKVVSAQLVLCLHAVELQFVSIVVTGVWNVVWKVVKVSV